MGKDNAPIPNATDEQFPTLQDASEMPRSPPKNMRRKCNEIEKTPERDNRTEHNPNINSVTPGATAMESTRLNKEPKKTKLQQTMIGFLNERMGAKEEIAKQPVVKVVATKRAQNGKRLILSGEKQRKLSEKAEKSRKEAAEAIKEEEAKAEPPRSRSHSQKEGTRPERPPP